MAEKPAPLNAGEIAELRSILEGRRARAWLISWSKNAAVWFTAVAGLVILLSKLVGQWVSQHFGIG